MPWTTTAAPTESEDDGSTRRAGGRPRGPSASTRYAVLSAAWRILADDGLTALTPTRLHAETGVARTTVYRHWPDASAVVADLVAGTTRRRVPVESSGDTRADLLAALGSLTHRLRHRPVASLLAALLAAEGGEESSGPTAADYVGALVEPVRHAILDGCRRGSLAGGDRPSHVDRLVRELVGPLLADVLLLGGHVDAIDEELLVDDFVRRHRPEPVSG